MNVQNVAPLYGHKRGDFFSIHQSPHQQQSAMRQRKPQSEAASVMVP